MSLHQRSLMALTAALAVLSGRPLDAATSLVNSLAGFTGDTTQAGTQADLAAAGLSVFSTTGEVLRTNNNGTPDIPEDDFLEVESNHTVTFDGDGAHFGSLIGGDGGRNYMRTIASDYATVSFSAEVSFTVSASLGTQQVYFGLGAGDTALFGTPDWSTQFSSASFWVEGGKIVSFRTQNDTNAFVDTLLNPAQQADIAGAGTHRVRMVFDEATKQLRGSLDIDYAGGPFVADVSTTFPIVTTSLFAADGWPTEPSRVFFGGDDGIVFRDLAITVPEPTALFAVAMALSTAALSRRVR